MKIEFRNVSHEYNQESTYSQKGISDISLTLETGKIYALIGPTGSGKSTFIQHLNGLLLPTSGEIYIEDEKDLLPLNEKGKLLRGKKKKHALEHPASYVLVPRTFLITPNKRKNKDLSLLRKRIGVVFQFPEQQLFEGTIVKDVAFGPKNYKIKNDEATTLAISALHSVNVPESYFERSPFDLSGGEQRKVAIAGILALDPEILVLDEPTAGLDPKNSEDILALVTNLYRLGKTIILITHDMEIALKYAHEIIVFRNGKIFTRASKEELLSNIETIDFIEIPASIKFAVNLKNQGFAVDLTKALDSNYLLDVIKRGIK